MDLNFNLFIPVTNLLAYTGGSEELEKVSFSSYKAFRFRLLGDRWFPIWYTAIFLSSPDRFWLSTKSGTGDRLNFGNVWKKNPQNIQHFDKCTFNHKNFWFLFNMKHSIPTCTEIKFWGQFLIYLTTCTKYSMNSMWHGCISYHSKCINIWKMDPLILTM